MIKKQNVSSNNNNDKYKSIITLSYSNSYLFYFPAPVAMTMRHHEKNSSRHLQYVESTINNKIINSIKFGQIQRREQYFYFLHYLNHTFVIDWIV